MSDQATTAAGMVTSTDQAPAATDTAAPEAETAATPEPSKDAGGDPFGKISNPEIKEWISKKGVKDVESLATSYRNLEKTFGANGEKVAIPQADDEAGWDEFFGKIGAPDSPDKYDLKAPEGVDEEFVESFKNYAAKAKLTKSQADKLFKEMSDSQITSTQKMREEMETRFKMDMDNLKREWGDGFERQLTLAKRAAHKMNLSEQELSRIEDSIGSAKMLKMFADFGTSAGEDSFVGSDSGMQSFGLTPSQAMQKVEQLRGDKSFQDRLANNDEAAMAHWQSLWESAAKGNQFLTSNE